MIEAVKTVMAGFLGIRRRDDHDRDAAALTPVRVIVAGLVLAALFVLSLIAIVRIVVG